MALAEASSSRVRRRPARSTLPLPRYLLPLAHPLVTPGPAKAVLNMMGLIHALSPVCGGGSILSNLF